MRQITDYIILLLYCLLAQYKYPVSPAFVAVLLLAVCINTFLYVYPAPHLRPLLTAGYSFLLFFLPEALLLLPLALYSYLFPQDTAASWRAPGFLIPAALCAAGIIFQTAVSHSMYLLFYVGCGCILSVSLHIKSSAYNLLVQKYKKTRDDGTEITFLLEEKNKSLLEKQDAQIYTATLKERNRIAREIHDNVGHLLTRSILLVGALKTLHPDDSLKEPLSQLDSTLSTAMNSIRESVHDLHDRSIDLAASLRSLTEGFLFCPVTLQYDMTSQTPSDVRYCFIAVTKEALSNISRHSNATKAFVTAVEHPAFYQLSIRDNGTTCRNSGSAVPPVPTAGIGLSNMKTRVCMLHGELRISTDNGFRIFITIPKTPSQTERGKSCGFY